MTRSSAKAGLALAGLCVPLLAPAAERLNVKLGLWEITTVTQMSGVPPLPKELMDRLTPEQRAKIAAEARANAAQGPDKDTSRECVTQKDLDEPFRSSNTEHCTTSVVSTTRTSQEMRMVCSGEPKGSGTFKVTAPTPETMSGTIDMKVGEGPDAFTVKGNLSGRWLSADCGEEADDSGDYDDAEDEPLDDDEEEEE
ncbi:MAG TPA: DUF3617 domain-containing protein [Povalibacter sp.]|nr:DUF3617 domain-containing protein [Povalibacter sp.]